MEHTAWKPVPNWEGLYEVSNTGLVRNSRTGKCVVGDVNTAGYKRALFARGGRRERIFVHRLVASVFCDGYFEGAVVNHKDANKKNNDASNLEWVTRSENAKHAHVIGHQPGSYKKVPCCVDFSNGMRAFYSSVRECAKAIGISKSLLYGILNSGNYIESLDAKIFRGVVRAPDLCMEF